MNSSSINTKKSGSIAVWCTFKNQPHNSSMETHFNFWRLGGNDNKTIDDIIEIGLLVKNPLPVESICIYLPTKISCKSICDCGPLFSNVLVAQGIFNEKMTTTIQTQPSRIILNTDVGHFCWVHKFSLNGTEIDANHLELDQSINDGTVLKITQNAIDYVSNSIGQDHQIYFRLRISLKNDKNNPFIKVITPQDKKFQSGFQEIEYIDFRLNEHRTLPVQIDQRMRAAQASGVMPITTVAFLAAIPVNSELSSSSIQWHKTRLLEHEPWKDYIPNNPNDTMVVYHGKKEEPLGVSDFSSYVKLHVRKSNVRIIGTYLAVAFVFGLLGNLVGSTIHPPFLTSLNWAWSKVGSTTFKENVDKIDTHLNN